MRVQALLFIIEYRCWRSCCARGLDLERRALTAFQGMENTLVYSKRAVNRDLKYAPKIVESSFGLEELREARAEKAGSPSRYTGHYLYLDL